MTHRNKITLVFLISPNSYPVEANIHEPLKVARDKALKDADQTGRPFDDWEVHYQGKTLTTTTKIEELGLVDGAELELTLGFGAGG
jgi:hypothetical protein